MTRPVDNTAAGFTLLEVLAAIAVMAVMLGSAATALSLLSDAAIRGATQADQLDMVARGLAAVRNDFSGIQRVTAIKDRKRRFVFQGDARQLQFVLIEPGYPSAPGSYVVTYSVRGTGRQTRLVRTRDAYDPGRKGPSTRGEEASEVTVMEGAYRFEFAYLARSVQPADWQSKWADSQAMPDLIRLRVTPTARDHAAVTDLVVHPRIDAEVTCVAGAKKPCTTMTGRLEETADAADNPAAGSGRRDRESTPK